MEIGENVEDVDQSGPSASWRSWCIELIKTMADAASRAELHYSATTLLGGEGLHIY